VRLPAEIEEAFFAGERSEAVPLVINDSVTITSGEHEGSGAAVISQVSMGEDPVYLVELGDSGKDVRVPLSSLRLDDEGET
jgi:hypothetical protein